MSRVRMWDLPVRLFHWLLAATFLAAFSIATLADDEGRVFALHALLGLGIAFMVILRVIWGLAGSRWARFTSFDLRPSALLRYLRGTIGIPHAWKDAGHNPATSWFVMAALPILLGLGATGLMSALDYESAEDLHEILAWSMLALAATHIAGVVWHIVHRRENIALGMVTGMKEGDPSAAIPSVRPWSAAVFLLLTVIWAASLAAGYDPATGRLTLPLTSISLQLREADD